MLRCEILLCAQEGITLSEADHNRTIIDQFTKQAVPFAKIPGHVASMDILIRMTHATRNDEVLDVACGPGLVACAFAPLVRHVTGIDITPGMIEQARAAQTEKGLTNLTWVVGPACPLPFLDGSFSIVLTRYSFHHFLHPEEVLAEMIRVCKPGGRILVADVLLPPDKVDLYNTAENLRDPSHVRALTHQQMGELIQKTSLKEVSVDHYKVEMELEKLLAGSFPNPGDADRVRQIFHDNVASDGLGVNAHLVGDEIHFAFPINVVAGTKPA